MRVEPRDEIVVRAWHVAIARPEVARALEGAYADVATAIAARGPACWASGRCCNFEKTGHRLYVTGLEAAYTVGRLSGLPTAAQPASQGISLPQVGAARARGGCPFQAANLCGVHPIRPLGCRVYFCDRSAQVWQQEVSEQALRQIRVIHDQHGVPYRYGEWRDMLALLLSA